MRIGSATPIRIASAAGVASIAPASSSSAAWNAGSGVRRVVSPARAAPSASLFPSQTETSVGSAPSIASICVRLPRISVASGLAPGPAGSAASSIVWPGTARFWTSGGLAGSRKKQEPVAIRSPLSGAASGGGQPGKLSSGTPNVAPAFSARRTGYASCWNSSWIPPDWNPAVMELPSDT